MAFKFTEEQLNTLDKSFIVNLFLQLQDQNDKLSGEIRGAEQKNGSIDRADHNLQIKIDLEELLRR